MTVANEYIPRWRECLAPPEYASFALVHSYYVSGAEAIPAVLYEAVWLFVRGGVGGPREIQARALLGLTYVEIVNPDGDIERFYVYVQAEVATWASRYLNESPCGSPCCSRPVWATF